MFVKGTDFLLEGGESSFRIAYSGVPAGPDRGGRSPAWPPPAPACRGSRARSASGRERLELARPRDISAPLRRRVRRLPPQRRHLPGALGRGGRAGAPGRGRASGWRSSRRLPTPREPRRGRHPHPGELPGRGHRSSVPIVHPRAPRGGGRERPRAREALLRPGSTSFAPIFLAVLLAGIGIALGLVLLILPGIYLAVRWYFVPQAVVVDGRAGHRRPRAFAASSCAGAGGAPSGCSSWQPGRAAPGGCSSPRFGASPRAPTAQSGRSWARSLAETITAPFVALFSTLLYYDLRARRRAALGQSA